MLRPASSSKAQIALEFLIVYSFVLIIFILLFSIISAQRAATLGQQQYSLLQLQSQNIASYIDQAAQAGTGYTASVPLVSGLSHNYYNLSISSTGVVIASTTVGTQPVVAYSFSHARGLVINGTLVRSSNGISIYQISTSKGTLSVSNLKGIIYVNEPTPSITNLVEGAIVTQQANVKAPFFNDTQKSYIAVNNSNALTLGTSFSVSLWFYANGERQGCGTLLGKSISSQFAIELASPCSAGYHANDILDFDYQDTVGASHILASSAFPANNWINAVAVFDGVNGIMTWYLNGVQVATYSGLGTLQHGSQTMYIGNGDFAFNGSIANLQMYNGIITSNQVSALYASGISGMPANSNLIGWWPLNGNGNDYSGFGDQGVPANNPKYSGVIQLSAQVYSSAGGKLANTLVGFATSQGSLGGNGIFSSGETNAQGLSSGFVTGTNGHASGTATADIFNGNVSTVANLIGWWPLDTGYGANIPDVSQNGDSGSFNGYWKPSANQTNFVAATFPGDGIGASRSATADGFVNISSSQSLLGVVTNKSFTVVAWIYLKGPTPAHNQGIFGNWPGSGGGFQLFGYCAFCANNAMLYVNGNYLSFPSGKLSFPTNTWEMVSAQYSGNNGTATVYLNGSVYATNVLPKNLLLLQTLPYYIGNDASQPGGLDSFNGSITNVQFYDSYLSQQQINSLYQSGISTPPLGNGGLIGWWPLLNNTVDYSSNLNNGVAHYNVIFVNSAYNNTANSNAQSFATFNGFDSGVIPFTNALSAKGSFTVSFWFDSFMGSSSAFHEDLVNAQLPGADGFDVQLCGDSSCGLSGLNGSIGSGSATLGAVTYPFSFNRNTWYSVTETFNTTGWVVYLNGNAASKGTYSGTPSLLGNSNHITLGAGTANGFVGQIADLQVYNSALTPQQAEQLYIQGLPIQYKMNLSLD
jgi:hypothetical protein